MRDLDFASENFSKPYGVAEMRFPDSGTLIMRITQYGADGV
jgi:hypothetical protein